MPRTESNVIDLSIAMLSTSLIEPSILASGPLQLGTDFFDDVDIDELSDLNDLPPLILERQHGQYFGDCQ